MKIVRSLFSFLPVLFFTSALSLASEPAPESAIQGFIGDIRAMEFPVVDEVKHADLVEKAHARLDLEALSKLALVDHWENLSLADRTTFISLLEDLIAAIAYKGTNQFMGDFEVLFPSVTPLDEGFEVKSIMKQGEEGLDAEVLYHVRNREGTWQIYDIYLDGISITEDLQYQWDQLIEEGGFSGLLDRMREKLAEASV